VAPPYRGNVLFRSQLLRRGVALVAAVALLGTGAGVGYLALVDRGRPLAGTSVALTEQCRYDSGRGGAVALAELSSVNDGAVTYRLTVGVFHAEGRGPVAQETVAVETPDGRSTQVVEVFVELDQARWDSQGYRECRVALDF
jgi:hypothetical protein